MAASQSLIPTRYSLLSTRGQSLSQSKHGTGLTPHRATGSGAGQAALSLVFLIGGIIIVVGVTLAFLSFSFINTSFGFQSAQRAEAIASAGARDALMQLARDNSFSSVGYNVPLGTDQATVVVTQSSPTAGQTTISSAATISNNTRQIRVIVSVDPSTGQVTVLSWQLQ